MNCNVTFKVKTLQDVDALYICGSTKNLGAWNPAKAAELKKDVDGYTVKKRFEKGEAVEFKVLCGKSWESVEKGYNFEEIENRCIIADNAEVEIDVANWS